MNKLISANLLRLRHSKIFWLCLAFSAGMSLLLVLMNYHYQQDGLLVTLKDNLLTFLLTHGFLIAAFCSLFIGTEYSDGTIRNKLIVGHGRIHIYMANLLVCVCASLLFCLSYLAMYIVFGSLLLGWFHEDTSFILPLMLASLTVSVSIAALCTMFAMLIANKAVMAIVNILLMLTLLFCGAYLQSQLSQPPVFNNYAYMSDSGAIVVEENVPNPHYPSGVKRQVFEFLYDFLPGAQQVQLMTMEAERPYLLIEYSLLITVAASAGGIFIFRRKDLK